MELIKHLLLRHYDPSRYKNQVLDLEGEILTVYLNNLAGQFVGFQKYNHRVNVKKVNNPKMGRYFTYSPRNTIAVWGLETLNYSKAELFIVEGIFKASSLHMIGKNAIAILGSNTKPMMSWLETLPFDLIGIGDNDKAGKKMIAKFSKSFIIDTDLDELDLEELDSLIEQNMRNLLCV